MDSTATTAHSLRCAPWCGSSGIDPDGRPYARILLGMRDFFLTRHLREEEVAITTTFCARGPEPGLLSALSAAGYCRLPPFLPSSHRVQCAHDDRLLHFAIRITSTLRRTARRFCLFISNPWIEKHSAGGSDQAPVGQYLYMIEFFCRSFLNVGEAGTRVLRYFQPPVLFPLPLDLSSGKRCSP